MNRTVMIIALILAALPIGSTAATIANRSLPYDRAVLSGEREAAPANPGARADTTWYGDYEIIGGEYYARSGAEKMDVAWTFDRGNGPFDPPPPLIPNGEGWIFSDRTLDNTPYFRAIDATLDLGQGVPPPIIQGERSLWVGADKPQSDALCWECGPGYGNNWCQRIVSPPLEYSGSGDVSLSFLYFNDSEFCFDGTQVYLLRDDASELLLNPYPSGTCEDNDQFDGGFTGAIGTYPAPAAYTRAITPEEFGGTSSYSIVIEFVGDGGWSDEDGEFCTTFGPLGVDDLRIVGGGEDASYDFETGLQGWNPAFCASVGAYAGIADLGCYPILDPCQCDLSGNVMELHDGECENGFHPDEQHEWVESPICDLGSDEVKDIFAEFDMYAETPMENGVLYRPGWRYYPWTCPLNGVTGWSPRVGQDTAYYTGSDPYCETFRVGGTTLGTGGTPIPPTARMVRFIYELQASCAAFAILDCSGETNFTPLLDNFAVGVTAGRVAPAIAFEVGARFQDVGSYLASDPNGSALFNHRMPGPANVVFDKYLGSWDRPELCGDSLVVTGPMPTSDPNTRWEARLWWRVAKRAPFQADKEGGIPTRYKVWRDRVADGKLIDRPSRPEFTWGWMDSTQYGSVVQRNKFLSSFREDDDDFVGEGNAENEMLWDDIFRPGTRIEYFVTSNYRATPNNLFYLPDTTGGNFLEFEILPGLKTAYVPACGGSGYDYCVYQPAILYIDVYNRAKSQLVIENALTRILHGTAPCNEPEGCPIPFDRNWDRYDYLDAASSWNCPIARGTIPGSNNGMTLNQIVGYKAILFNTGDFGAGTAEDPDFALFDDWLHTPLCNSNAERQVFLMNGDKAGEILSESYNPNMVAFLTDVLGARLECDAFNGNSFDPDCDPPSYSYCVRYLAYPGGPFGTDIDVDAFGSFCPDMFGFNVYQPVGTGMGNRYYEAEDGSKTAYFGQIANQNLAGDANWRAAIDGVSWNHMTARNPGGSGNDRCPRELPWVIAGVTGEIGAALKWGFGAADYSGIPRLTAAERLGVCQGTWSQPSDAPDSAPAVTRLYPNEPNPFNPRTTIRYSLARKGSVEICVYDVSGRLVRTLVDGVREAGLHSAVWDGTNDAGHRAGSGVYWAQMKAGDYTSAKRMVILK